MSDENPTASPDIDAPFGLAVRDRRGRLGITLDQLAQASGVSAGALSRIERGLLGVSLRNAIAIAQGLGCDLSELVQAQPALVTRAGEHLRFLHEASQVERLALAHPRPGLELLQYSLPLGAQSEPFAAHQPGTREVFHVLDGQIKVWTATEALTLGPGDTATLLMDTEHRFENVGTTPARLILLIAGGPG